MALVETPCRLLTFPQNSPKSGNEVLDKWATLCYNPTMTTLIAALKAVKTAERLTQQDMAEALGISQRMVSAIFLGQRQPGAKVLRAIARRWPGLRDEIWQALSE